MEQINKKLTEKQKQFLNNLSIHIDKPIYFYGSIYRADYFPGKSDIDIDIFTDNETSTIQMLCNFLNINRNEFKKSFYKLDATLVRGFKGKYKDESNNINVEISIYNDKYKTIVLDEHNKGKSMPLYISILLIIVKFCYYNLGIISNDIYNYIKRIVMNPGAELKYILVYS
jgi:predicted nucleotidyltransferase